jgi:hypothetical protein
MDMGSFNLFIKMIVEEFKLDSSQVTIITERLLADDGEFERVWKFYKNRPRKRGGVDRFKEILQELLN